MFSAMKSPLVQRALAGCLMALAMTGMSATRAAAVPAFAIQTGAPCQSCHVGGFGPQLTTFGREFKLRGYTTRTTPFNTPFSAMAVASYVHTLKDQPPPAPQFGGNDNTALDQISLFFAGGFGQHLGAFIQTTYDGIAKAWSWDNVDVRATTRAKIHDTDMVLGVSLNNSPSAQDAWNTLPAWGSPYTGSDLAPSPSASPLFNGALAQTSLGVTGYAWINSEVYLEAGGYTSPSAHTLTRLGADPTDPGSIHGLAPYGRVALQKALGDGTVEVGAFGMRTNIYPGMDQTTGFTDRYSDVGLDGSYIRTLANSDAITFNARYMHENQRLDATCALAGVAAGCAETSLNDVRADASYYWRNKIGATVMAFDTYGPANPTVYADNRTFKPDSSGVTLQLDATPWGAGGSPLGPRFNMRVGLQYTAFAKFNGATHDYDGLGHDARDNDSIRLFSWIAF